MRIYAFIDQYCQDLVEEFKKKKKLIDLVEFPHDGVVTDVAGNSVPVVFVDNESIPVSDFFTLDKSDFVSTWKTPSASEAYDNYVSAVEILEGEEALSRVRNAIMQERARLEEDVKLITEI